VPTQRPFVSQCSLVDSSLFGAEGLSTKDKRTSSIDRRVALGSGFAKVAKSGGTGIPIATKQVAIQGRSLRGCQFKRFGSAALAVIWCLSVQRRLYPAMQLVALLTSLVFTSVLRGRLPLLSRELETPRHSKTEAPY
jgi:hypothetical protein